MKRLLEKIGVIAPGVEFEGGETGEDGDGGANRVDNDVQNIGDVRAVVLINMGANRNLARLFASSVAMDESEYSQESMVNTGAGRRNHRCRCYVFDCHRPYHLSNIHAGRNVVLFNDRPFEEGEVPSDGDNLSGDESSSSEEEEDSDEDEEGEDEDGNGRKWREDEDEGEEEFDGDDVIGTASSPVRNSPIRRNDGEDADESEVEGSDVEEEDDIRKANKRQRTDRSEPRDGDDPSDNLGLEKQKDRTDEDYEEDNPLDVTALTADLTLPTQDTQDLDDDNADTTQTLQQTPMTFRELHLQRRNRIRIHYSAGSYHASPSAWSIYTLSSQLRFGGVSDLLWLACVGVTDAYLHGRLDVAGYSALCVDLKRHVGRLFPNELVDRVGRAVYAEELEESALNNNQNNASGAGGEAWTQIGLSENGRILCQSEYRFMLLRHTSLWDSMFHSNFVASKLQVWRGPGKQRLMELLAKMGFPLDQCRQPFAFVAPKLRRRLKDQIEEHTEVSDSILSH